MTRPPKAPPGSGAPNLDVPARRVGAAGMRGASPGVIAWLLLASAVAGGCGTLEDDGESAPRPASAPPADVSVDGRGADAGSAGAPAGAPAGSVEELGWLTTDLEDFLEVPGDRVPSPRGTRSPGAAARTPAGEPTAGPSGGEGPGDEVAPPQSGGASARAGDEAAAPSEGERPGSEAAPSRADGSGARREGEAEGEAALPVMRARVAKSGERDMTRTDYDKGCLRSGCHAALAELPFAHGPVTIGACDTCHEPDAKEGEDPHAFRLARPRETLCSFCHRPETAAKVAHQPYAEGTCMGCHDAHGGENQAFLAAGSIEELCNKCHEPMRQEHLHGPVAVGECLTCHAAHQSDFRGLTTRGGQDLCTSCHLEVRDALAAASHVHGPAATDCEACHLSHGGNDKLFLRAEPNRLCLGCHDLVSEELAKAENIHGALEGPAGCMECHTPHASEWATQLRANPGELCLGCHDRELVDPVTKETVANVASVIATSKFKHGPVQTGECQGCHLPHAAAHVDLLRARYPPRFYEEFSESSYELCFECHERTLVLAERTTTLTKFRDGDVNLHYLHVNREKGRTCRACHEVHASNFPSHIRESVPFGSVGWPLPLNFEKTETGGSCSPGCHKPLTYVNTGATSSSAPSRERDAPSSPAGG